MEPAWTCWIIPLTFQEKTLPRGKHMSHKIPVHTYTMVLLHDCEPHMLRALTHPCTITEAFDDNRLDCSRLWHVLWTLARNVDWLWDASLLPRPIRGCKDWAFVGSSFQTQSWHTYLIARHLLVLENVQNTLTLLSPFFSFAVSF